MLTVVQKCVHVRDADDIFGDIDETIGPKSAPSDANVVQNDAGLL
jgi:hypothetical protein